MKIVAHFCSKQKMPPPGATDGGKIQPFSRHGAPVWRRRPERGRTVLRASSLFADVPREVKPPRPAGLGGNNPQDAEILTP